VPKSKSGLGITSMSSGDGVNSLSNPSSENPPAKPPKPTRTFTSELLNSQTDNKRRLELTDELRVPSPQIGRKEVDISADFLRDFSDSDEEKREEHFSSSSGESSPLLSPDEEIMDQLLRHNYHRLSVIEEDIAENSARAKKLSIDSNKLKLTINPRIESISTDDCNGADSTPLSPDKYKNNWSAWEADPMRAEVRRFGDTAKPRPLSARSEDLLLEDPWEGDSSDEKDEAVFVLPSVTEETANEMNAILTKAAKDEPITVTVKSAKQEPTNGSETSSASVQPGRRKLSADSALIERKHETPTVESESEAPTHRRKLGTSRRALRRKSADSPAPLVTNSPAITHTPTHTNSPALVAPNPPENPITPVLDGGPAASVTQVSGSPVDLLSSTAMGGVLGQRVEKQPDGSRSNEADESKGIISLSTIFLPTNLCTPSSFQSTYCISRFT